MSQITINHDSKSYTCENTAQLDRIIITQSLGVGQRVLKLMHFVISVDDTDYSGVPAEEVPDLGLLDVKVRVDTIGAGLGGDSDGANLAFRSHQFDADPLTNPLRFPVGKVNQAGLGNMAVVKAINAVFNHFEGIEPLNDDGTVKPEYQ